MSTHKLWELLAFLIIIGVLAKVALTMIVPLVPYILAGLVIFAGGSLVYRRMRTW